MTALEPKKLWTVAIVALLLGLLFDNFFYGKQVGISFFMYVALLLVALFGLLSYLKIPYNKKALWYLVPILFFSGMIAVRASMFLMFWNFLATLGLLMVFSAHLAGKSVKDYWLFDYVKIVIMFPLIVLAKSFNSLGRLLGARKQDGGNGKSSQV